MSLPEGKHKICLAYSGGLDTSTILAWLLEAGHEVVCFCADIGRKESQRFYWRLAPRVLAHALLVQDPSISISAAALVDNRSGRGCEGAEPKGLQFRMCQNSWHKYSRVPKAMEY